MEAFIFLLIVAIIYFIFFSKKSKRWSEEYELKEKESKSIFKEKIRTKFSEEEVIITLEYLTADNSVIGIDEGGKKVCFLINQFSESKGNIDKVRYKAETYDYRDILESEVIIDGETVTKTSRSSQIGGALVGAALTGGVGAIIGGLSGKKTSKERVEKVHLKLIVNSFKNPVILLSFLNTNSPIDKRDEKFAIAHKKVMEMHGLFVALINQADQADKAHLSGLSHQTQKMVMEKVLHANKQIPLNDAVISKEILEEESIDRNHEDSKVETSVVKNKEESNKNDDNNIVDEIRKIHALFVEEIITEEEYKKLKEKLLR